MNDYDPSGPGMSDAEALTLAMGIGAASHVIHHSPDATDEERDLAARLGEGMANRFETTTSESESDDGAPPAA